MATNQTDDVWNALGDGTRRAIVACLAQRPHAVGELATVMPVSRPAISQHLKVLKQAGLVTEQAAGTRRIYRLNPAGVTALRDQLDTYWNMALANYSDLLEQDSDPPEHDRDQLEHDRDQPEPLSDQLDQRREKP